MSIGDVAKIGRMAEKRRRKQAARKQRDDRQMDVQRRMSAQADARLARRDADRDAAAKRRKARRAKDIGERRLAAARKSLAKEPGYCKTHRVVHGPTSPVREPETCEVRT